MLYNNINYSSEISYLNNTLLLNTCNSISTSSLIILSSSKTFLPGITMLTSLSLAPFKVTVFLARRYESVAIHSKISPVILKFKPVRSGLNSWVEIAKAVEKLFQVKVLKVNTINVNGKKKRVGYHVGKTSDWKKAIVTIDTNPGEATYLAKGGKETKATKKFKDSIDEFMGA